MFLKSRFISAVYLYKSFIHTLKKSTENIPSFNWFSFPQFSFSLIHIVLSSPLGWLKLMFLWFRIIFLNKSTFNHDRKRIRSPVVASGMRTITIEAPICPDDPCRHQKRDAWPLAIPPLSKKRSFFRYAIQDQTLSLCLIVWQMGCDFRFRIEFRRSWVYQIFDK